MKNEFSAIIKSSRHEGEFIRFDGNTTVFQRVLVCSRISFKHLTRVIPHHSFATRSTRDCCKLFSQRGPKEEYLFRSKKKKLKKHTKTTLTPRRRQGRASCIIRKRTFASFHPYFCDCAKKYANASSPVSNYDHKRS